MPQTPPPSLIETSESPNLAAAYRAALQSFGDGNFGAAETGLRSVLHKDPDHLGAARLLVTVLENAGDRRRAAAARRRVRRIEAENACAVGATMLAYGGFRKAEAAYRQALDLMPDFPPALAGLGDAAYGRKKMDQALDYYRRYLEQDPDDPSAQHMVAALERKTSKQPDRASQAYVRDTFDAYADHFDQSLMEDLAYRAPEVVADIVRQGLTGVAAPDAPDAPHALDVLDLGCGTGLSGAPLRAIAGRLDGVDLSSRMLAQAKNRGIYDRLTRGDIIEVMDRRPGRYDLLLAVDALNYFGDLDDVFRAAAVALRPGGRLAATFETQRTAGFSLTGSGRYAHSPGYVRSVARRHGFGLELSRRDVLRTEFGRPVQGDCRLFRR